jgi:UDP-perosamine 4-acetyltransferase
LLKVIGIGAGGHARAIIDALQLARQAEIVGLLVPDPVLRGSNVLGVPVLGDDERLPSLRSQGIEHAFLGVGSTGYPGARMKLFRMLGENGFRVVSVVHPSAVVSSSARLGVGAVVLANAVIGPMATLGDNVIVNSAAVVEHDCQIADHCHIAPGALLAGGVRVGPRSHVGLGACLIEKISVGADSIVGAGAVVVADVTDGVVVAGVPARVLRPATLDAPQRSAT